MRPANLLRQITKHERAKGRFFVVVKDVDIDHMDGSIMLNDTSCEL